MAMVNVLDIVAKMLAMRIIMVLIVMELTPF